MMTMLVARLPKIACVFQPVCTMATLRLYWFTVPGHVRFGLAPCGCQVSILLM